MKPECVAEVKAMKLGRYIGPREHACEGGDCDNFVPEGRYGFRPAYLTCSRNAGTTAASRETWF